MIPGVSRPSVLYRQPLALLTDLYEVTMAHGFWRAGVHDHEAVYHLYFRQSPFGGGYTISCGLEHAIDFLEHFRFGDEDLAYLESLAGNDGRPLFQRGFLDSLKSMRFSCDVDAIPEGSAVFPPEPLLRVRGPIAQCQLVESALLNIVNFQSLIATKAARVCSAAGGDTVVEFGLRRAQGIDGALAASRAAYAGGCPATSNLLAGKLLGIPVKGTHAHSWVMFFPSEREAFLEWASATPNNCIFLVDTYDTLAGVSRAVEAGRWLREHGHEMIGIRLDSGDLAYLSIEARKILDRAGFPGAVILASNELDERIIESLKGQGARIDHWGVGTRLVTGHEQPALGGTYKLSAVRGPGGCDWDYKLKLSEQSIKVSYPGVLQVRRFVAGSEFVGDAIWDEPTGIDDSRTIIDPLDSTRRKVLPADAAHEDLLVPVFREGRPVYARPTLEAIQRRTRDQLARFHAGVKRFVHPHQYPVGLEPAYHDLRTRLTLEARARRAT
jgi:nicotinate phosphoribosyltransferase